ncbi:Lar family restriction alleviation protein [Burkholderia gladioli]|uniref:Lar family restriction alleviation protein n=1 Tax=Burkholderia gladioli TaxID=28095 RepID=UPI001641E88A|nr:Lar family restriction alleviation protein [Burkholderia gladioli]
MSDKLRDCPFCGRSVYVSQRTIGGWKFVYCSDCLAEGPGHDSEAEAIAAWNRRAAPAPAISESDVLIVPARVGELIDAIKRDGLLKRAAEFSEMCRLIDAARKGGCDV